MSFLRKIIDKIRSRPFQEATKDFVRIMLISILPVGVEFLQGGIPYETLGVAVVIALIKGANTWLHYRGKELYDDNQGHGLIPPY